MLGKELVTQSFTSRFSTAPVLCLQDVVHAHRPLARQQSSERRVHLYTNLNFIFTVGHSWQQRILKGNKVKQQKLWMSWQMPTRRGEKSMNFYIFFTLKSCCPLDLRKSSHSDYFIEPFFSITFWLFHRNWTQGPSSSCCLLSNKAVACFSHKGIVKIAVQQKVHMYRLHGNSLKVVAVYSFLVAQEDIFQSLLSVLKALSQPKVFGTMGEAGVSFAIY